MNAIVNTSHPAAQNYEYTWAAMFFRAIGKILVFSIFAMYFAIEIKCLLCTPLRAYLHKRAARAKAMKIVIGV